MKIRKAIRQGVTALLAVSLVIAGTMMPAPKASAAKKIKLNKTKLTLKVGASYQLKLKNSKAKVKWKSSKKKIAAVSSKGKVKAKKKGSAVITATAGGKKYKCKITVKKADKKTTNSTPKPGSKNTSTTKAPTQTTQSPGSVPPTPIPTPVPYNPGNTDDPDISDDPDDPDDPTPTPTKEPIELSPLAKNITLEAQLLSNHLMIKVTNKNAVWVDEVSVNYDYYDTEMNNIANGHAELPSMQPNEVQYIAIETSETFTAIDDNASIYYPDVQEADESTEYQDIQQDVEITSETARIANGDISLHLMNHSRYDADVSYAVLFYTDSTKTTLVDVSADTVKLGAKGDTDETVKLPVDEEADVPTVLSTVYDIVYTAHAAIAIDDTTPYVKNITLDPQKTTYTLLVDVTNNNTNKWLSSLSLEYYFYDAEDRFLVSQSADLLSMQPGKNGTQTIPFNLDAETIQNIDLANSYAEITLEPAGSDTKYNTTSQVSASVVYDAELNDFAVTLSSLSRYNTEGSYLIKFYSDTAKKNLIGAEQRPYTLGTIGAENATFTDNLFGPVITDENNTKIYAAAYDIKVQSSNAIMN